MSNALAETVLVVGVNLLGLAGLLLAMRSPDLPVESAGDVWAVRPGKAEQGEVTEAMAALDAREVTRRWGPASEADCEAILDWLRRPDPDNRCTP